MTFYIDKLLLWLNNGHLRTLQFSNDKVNVITGNSKTGKTAILEIIDYCLCGGSDTVVISQEHIAENVAWYGIRFIINNKTYTIARGAISDKGEFSKDYFFSQTGEIPDVPCVKMDEKELKSILNHEFSIDDEITVSYGGKGIKKNTRLSFRYFLLFNTLSKDIIDNGKMFFDKMTIERYRDVWHQIFDLAIGVITPETLEKQKEYQDISQALEVLEQNKRKEQQKHQIFSQQQQMLVKQAKEAGLIDEAVADDEAIEELKRLVENDLDFYSTNYSTKQKYEELQEKRDDIALQLTKLKRFKQSYSEYRARLQAEKEALSSISYIQAKFSDRTQGEYRRFLNSLSVEFEKIKFAISKKQPFEWDIERKIKELEQDKKALDLQIKTLPRVEYKVIPAAQKLISLGELRANYKQLKPLDDKSNTIAKDIEQKLVDLSDIESQLTSIDDRRLLLINTLNEYTQYYIRIAKEALDEYGSYNAWFDYKKSILSLKKDRTSSVANISSSSDHLYMHLCLFAGLHNMLLMDNSKYVPSYLIIDQPSRPYFNTESYDYTNSEASVSKKDDWSKVKDIFKLWDSFYDIVLEQKKHFQIIMLEHVAESAWKDCKHVNLVAIFDGVINALIPPEAKMN